MSMSILFDLAGSGDWMTMAQWPSGLRGVVGPLRKDATTGISQHPNRAFLNRKTIHWEAGEPLDGMGCPGSPFSDTPKLPGERMIRLC
jgi:hypothetical protein